MNIEEQLKEDLISIQVIAENKISQITNAKLKYVKCQDFEEAVKISKVETAILEFISLSDKITDYTKSQNRTKKIKEIFNNNNTNKMKQISKEQNQELELELIKEFGKEADLDGILNLEEYNKTAPKILWILKEGNWGEEYIGNTDDGEKASTEEANDILEEKQIDMKTYYDNVPEGYSRWRATFENISYITHGIIERIYKYDDMSDIDGEAKIDDKYYINKVAFINIKKAPGGSVANNNLVADSYRNHKEFLLKQINTINPDIVINCSSIKELTLDLSEGHLLNEELNFVRTNDRIIINAYHPAYPYRNGKSASEEYVDRCLQIIKNYYF